MRLFPDQFSGGKLDATQIRPAMLPGVAVKAIDVILINYPGGVMRGNGVVKVPESFRFALFHADELRAKFVPAGKKNKITEDDRSDFSQANASPWLWNGTKSAVLPVASLTPHRMATAVIWQSAMLRERRPVALNNSAALRASTAGNGSGADRRSWASNSSCGVSGSQTNSLPATVLAAKSSPVVSHDNNLVSATEPETSDSMRKFVSR